MCEITCEVKKSDDLTHRFFICIDNTCTKNRLKCTLNYSMFKGKYSVFESKSLPLNKVKFALCLSQIHHLIHKPQRP